MNQFYLNNSYIPLLDSAQLLSDSQGVVYFKLPVETSPPLYPGGNLPGPLDTATGIPDDMIINAPQAEPVTIPGPIGAPEFPGALPIGTPAAEGGGLEVVGSPADGATGPPSGTPLGGGSGY